MIPNKNVGASIKAFPCGAGRLVAAGTGDATAVTGKTIDRKSSEGALYMSGVLALVAHANLTAAKTLSLAVEYQTSADDSTWETAVALQASTALNTATGESTLAVEFDVNLSSLERYVRFNYTPDLSHSGTDVAEVAAVFLAGGAGMPV